MDVYAVQEVPMQARRGQSFLLGLELQPVVSRHVDAGSQTGIL